MIYFLLFRGVLPECMFIRLIQPMEIGMVYISFQLEMCKETESSMTFILCDSTKDHPLI